MQKRANTIHGKTFIQELRWEARVLCGLRCRLSRKIAASLRNEKGQGTVEYALVVFALLAIVVALGVLWRMFDDGVFVSHAAWGASHHLQSVSLGALGDILLY